MTALTLEAVARSRRDTSLMHRSKHITIRWPRRRGLELRGNASLVTWRMSGKMAGRGASMF
jgi:hypothetical protein